MNEEKCPVCSSHHVEVTPLDGILIPKITIRCLEHTCGKIVEKELT